MKEFFDYLAKHNVSPNGYYVLHATFNKYYHTNYVNIRSEQYRLTLAGYLKDDGNGVYTITTTGSGIVRNAEKILNKVAVAKKKVPFEEWEEHIVKFNEMFPKGRRPDSTVAFRTNPKELYDRFVWFFSEYPEYTWELVHAATEQYTDTFRESGEYTYMQNSKYFVKKDDKNKQTVSGLATMCWNIVEGNDQETNADGYHYFGP